ncbi:hypothetical protein ACFQ05_32460 [Amycolatopsis umgeniensis]|uniref:Uncharacterized protein n=1 Tax=Amycolatopsis umgeniensis TaxID=336628 RepID=A0A841AU32_9PSEU|nr:hypothetical protein [Amycolatopsis umgeniensis]MBB5850497.1 hypothetical protein [Amycolatopsis umgeniensis]
MNPTTAITWTTDYYSLAAEQLRAAGVASTTSSWPTSPPAHSQDINFFGPIEVDIDGELAHLGPTGYRPLHIRDTLF